MIVDLREIRKKTQLLASFLTTYNCVYVACRAGVILCSHIFLNMCTPAKCKNSVSPPGNCGRKKLFCNSLIVSYTLFLSTVPGHYQSIALIPDGTRNIQIKELSGFKNYLGKFKSGCKLTIASLSSIISYSI